MNKKTAAILPTGLPLALLMPLFAACTDALTGPATAVAPQDPSPALLVLPAVQSARLAVQRQVIEIEDGTGTILSGEILVEWVRFEDGTMNGVLQIWLDEHDPPQTFLAVEGEVSCSSSGGQDLNRDHSLLHGSLPANNDPLLLTIERVDPAGSNTDKDHLRHTLDFGAGTVLSFVATGQLWHAEDVCASRTAGL